MYLTPVWSTGKTQVNNNQESRCAICGQVKKPTKLYERVPTIFTTELTGGAPCAPYVTHLDLYLCSECYTQMLKDAEFFSEMQTRNIIHFHGCMNNNVVYNKPLH